MAVMESVKQRLLLSILFLRGKSARSYCENQLGPVHTTTEFENGGLTLKRHHCFPSTLRWRNKSPVILNLCLCFEDSSLQDYREGYQQTPLSTRFLSTRKRQAGVFKFFWFEERFRKALFL